MLETRNERDSAVVDISFPEIEKFDRLPQPTSDSATAFVSIMEGCSKYYLLRGSLTRGEEVSRPVMTPRRDRSLGKRGCQRGQPLGQNVNAYRGENHLGDIVDFAELLGLVNLVPGIERIRYTTSHPVEFSDALIECYRDIPALVDHLHLPVQGGSDRVLMAMKRGHTAIEYKAKIRALSYSPEHIALF